MKIIFTIIFFISFSTFGLDKDRNEMFEDELKQRLMQKKEALEQLKKYQSKNLEGSCWDYAKCIWVSAKQILCCCCDCPEFNHYDEVKAQQNFDEENMLQKQCSVDVLKNLTVNTVPTCTETNLQLPPGLTLRKIKINVEPNHEDKDENFYKIIREETGKNLVFTQTL